MNYFLTFCVYWGSYLTKDRLKYIMAFRLISKILCDSPKSKYWNVSRRFHGTSFSETRFLGRSLCMQTFLQASRPGRNCLSSRICFKRGLRTGTALPKEKGSDLKRLFGLAKPEAFRIAGMVSHNISWNLIKCWFKAVYSIQSDIINPGNKDVLVSVHSRAA